VSALVIVLSMRMLVNMGMVVARIAATMFMLVAVSVFVIVLMLVFLFIRHFFFLAPGGLADLYGSSLSICLSPSLP
jgi:hypothetical protein